MIAIINKSEKNKKGETKYHVYINKKLIVEFWYRRENGLGLCLFEASKAVEKKKWKSFAKYFDDE